MNSLTMIPFAFVTLIASYAFVIPASAADADGDADGVPDSAEPLIGTDPKNPDTDGDGANDLADTTPTQADNPIAADGAAAPFTIGEVLVENNYDPTLKQDAPDHLELQVVNSGASDLTGFSLYVSIADADSGQVESFFAPLAGFVVPANGEARIHFDDSGEPGHFRANPNSIYVTGQAAKTFTLQLKAEGFAPLDVTIAKDAGGAETAD